MVLSLRVFKAMQFHGCEQVTLKVLLPSVFRLFGGHMRFMLEYLEFFHEFRSTFPVGSLPFSQASALKRVVFCSIQQV